jgi:hypothetical protein
MRLQPLHLHQLPLRQGLQVRRRLRLHQVSVSLRTGRDTLAGAQEVAEIIQVNPAVSRLTVLISY